MTKCIALEKNELELHRPTQVNPINNDELE